MIDGQELNKISVPYLRDKISIVQQEPILFNETIKGNIRYGNLEAQDHEIRNVANQANAMGFIMQSEEDVTSPEVQARLRQEYTNTLNSLVGSMALS